MCFLCERQLADMAMRATDARGQRADAASAANNVNTDGLTALATEAELSGITYIDALVNFYKWDFEGRTTTLTYSFPWQNGIVGDFSAPSGQNYSPSNEHLATRTAAFNNNQIQATDIALQNFSNVANINFSKIAENGKTVGDLRLAFSSAVNPSEAAAWAYIPDSIYASGGDMWFDVGDSSDNFSPGTNNFRILMHEIGHALGLKHPFDTKTFNSTVLSKADDNTRNTVMSYTELDDFTLNNMPNDEGIVKNIGSVKPTTLMVYDIAVMQHLYGKNDKFMIGDDIYSFDVNTPFYKTIWDAGGTDTISVANFIEGCNINLQPGSYSTITIISQDSNGFIWRENVPADFYDRKPNLGIAFDCVIENAIGGSGDDIISGNDANNSITGASGNDTLDGGIGVDTAIFSGSRSQYSISSNGASMTVSDNVNARDGVDTLRNFEFFRFSDQTISADLSPYALTALSSSVNEGSTAAFILTATNVAAGTQVAYTLSGISAADIQGGALTGTAIVGSNGQATISVALLADTLTEGAETLTVTAAGKTALTTINDTSVGLPIVQSGTSGSDTFRITSGSNNIDGGAGSDIVQYQTTRSGASVTFNNGTITVNKTGGTDTLISIERIDFTDGDLIFDVTSSNAPAAYRLYGGAFARTPDEGGFRFWTSTLDANVSLRDVATQFIGSEEFIGRYGSSLSNAAFVDALYQNVLSRGGDAGGVAHWNRMLDNKFQDRSDILVQFTQLPEFVGISAANITNGYWVV
jgi:serralysin